MWIHAVKAKVAFFFFDFCKGVKCISACGVSLKCHRILNARSLGHMTISGMLRCQIKPGNLVSLRV